MFSSVQEFEKAEFPSVTFCKTYTYRQSPHGLLEDIDNWKNTSTSYLKQWVQNQTMDREELFYFINHPTESRKFPCDAVAGSGRVGHPCVFPFMAKDCRISNKNYPTKSFFCNTFEDKIMTGPFYNCTPSVEATPWCAARTYANHSQIPGDYGYCSPSCKGELPSRDRPEYLAGPGFYNLWETRMFDLRTWESGLCHTYTPNDTFQPGSLGHLYAFLGDKDDDNNLHHFEIYLHSSQVMSFLIFLNIAFSYVFNAKSIFVMKVPKHKVK